MVGRSLQRVQPVTCPECGSTRIGRIGSHQYYCSDCCLELQLGRDRVDLFAVDEEGNLVPVGRRPLVGAGSPRRPGSYEGGRT
jgi:endogenous inhibitor of DNA gyrase (YacG/DUF329 family)